MTIKRVFQNGMLLLLALSMLLSFSACNNGDEVPTPTVGSGQETDDPNAKQLAFPKTDFKSDFNILYPAHGVYNDFFFATMDQAGETMADAILERSDLVYDYLGVDVYGVPTPLHNTIAIRAVAIEMSNKVASGDDSYQMVLAQAFESVTPMALGGYLLDFYSMEYVDLEADYWNKPSVDALAINGVGYYAMSDYLIPDPNAIFFNKEMLSDFSELEDPYALVRNGQWTLAKFFEMCAAVEYDNEGVDDPMQGMYGLSVMADSDFIALIDSCDVGISDDYDGTKILNMSAGNDKYATLLDTVFQKMSEDWVYLFPYGASQDIYMGIDKGTALFTMENLKDA